MPNHEDERVASLRAWRMQAPMTLRELASASGVSERTIQDAEGALQRVRPATMRKLAGALGIEVRQVAEFRPLLGLD